MKTLKAIRKSFRLLGDVYAAAPDCIPLEIASILCSVLQSMLVRIALVKVILDLVIASAFGQAIALAAVAAVGDWLLSAFLQWMTNYYRPAVAVRLHKHFHEQLYRGAVAVDLKAYDDAAYYDRYILAAQNSDSTAQRFLSGMREAIVSVLEIAISGGMIVGQMKELLWIVLIPSTLYALLSMVNANARDGMNQAANPHQKKMSYVRRTVFMRNSALDLRTLGLKGKLFDLMREGEDGAIQAMKPFAYKRLTIYLINGLLFYLQYAAFIGFLAWRAMVVGDVTVGEFSLLLSAAMTMNNNWRFFGTTLSSLAEYGLFSDHYYRFVQDVAQAKRALPTKEPGEFETLSTSNVAFSYPNSDKDVFTQLSMDIKRKQKVAIVGANGAGKSTLVGLMLGLYAPKGGTVQYNHDSIADLDTGKYRARFSTVFQDSKLYPFTIAQNLLLREPETPEDIQKIWGALRLVGLEKRIADLAHGLDTMVTKEFDAQGVVFSGGELQRMVLARSLIADASVFIMDEPTSAQDPRSESELNHLFTTLMEDKTIVLISHRLSTISGVDYIYYIENGRVEEKGTHQQLMSLNGRYADIYNRQVQLYEMLE